jgi:hypothetical protein
LRKVGPEASAIVAVLQSICEPMHSAQKRSGRIISAA